MLQCLMAVCGLTRMSVQQIRVPLTVPLLICGAKYFDRGVVEDKFVFNIMSLQNTFSMALWPFSELV